MAFENGFIYEFTGLMVKIFNGLNLVEYLKKLLWWIAQKWGWGLSSHDKKEKSQEKIKLRDARRERKYKNMAIDIFIILKFVLLGALWIWGGKSIAATVVIFYLIFMTMHTYFFHHIWREDKPNGTGSDIHRYRRRFISMLLAFIFVTLSYGYLYSVPFRQEVAVPAEKTVQADSTGTQSPAKAEVQKSVSLGGAQAIEYSLSNALGGGFSDMEPATSVGRWLALSQGVITFVFITLIVSKSISN